MKSSKKVVLPKAIPAIGPPCSRESEAAGGVAEVVVDDGATELVDGACEKNICLSMVLVQ